MSDPNVTDPSRAPAVPGAPRSASRARAVLSLRLPEAELEKLRDALREGDERWHEVEAADGAVLVDLGQVVYLRVDSDEHRIGF